MTSTLEQVADPEPIWRLGIALFSRKALTSAIELGVFAALAGGPAPAAEICARTGLHQRGARDFLDTLVALGMLERSAGQYAASAVARRYLDPAKPSYVGAFLIAGDARWDLLTEALRSGKPQTGVQRGTNMFTDYRQGASAWRTYAAGMEFLDELHLPAVAAALDWNAVGTVADLGGSRGHLVCHLAAACPRLHGIVFDLPPMAAPFDEHVSALGLTSRVEFQPGNFFADELPRADVLVLSHVLHNWAGTERDQLLSAAYHALPADGVLLICDPMIDDDRRHHPERLLASLNMLLVTPDGAEYTAADCRGWLADAGFGVVTQADGGVHDTILLARKGLAR